MARLYLSFDVHHFEIEELSFLTLYWDFRKEGPSWIYVYIYSHKVSGVRMSVFIIGKINKVTV